MRLLLRFAVLMLCLIVPTSGYASDMDRVVRALEADLGVHHTHLPMIGAAMFVGRVATGFRMPGVKLVVFEDEAFSQRSPEEIQHSVINALGPQWNPFIKSISKYGEEQSWIYLSESGNKLQMFIASVEQNELSLIEVKVSESQMRRWINDTDEMVKKH
jgi:hypothetical protein